VRLSHLIKDYLLTYLLTYLYFVCCGNLYMLCTIPTSDNYTTGQGSKIKVGIAICIGLAGQICCWLS